MGVAFYGYVKDGDVWTWPAAMNGRTQESNPPAYGTPEWMNWYNGDLDCSNPNYDARLNVDITNRNAQLVLNELGLLGSDMDVHNCEVMALDAFEAGLMATIARNKEAVPGIAGYEDTAPGGSTWLHFGVPDGYVNGVLARLAVFVAACKEYGATHIGWG